ncbi:MAG: DUF2851 family protein [Candidatus Nitronauta litoralis]|uniref:DUF2851 family protein n=1 Tax=Candidatus Nitronauta litoralis TaxID=2705533 RepID=A0A7T0BW29_9BACT|nr:MAG: DUF2851 family protein [Candidatus Nitronauta litoralis]
MTAAVFTDIYRKFTEVYQRTLVEEEDAPQIPEKVLRCVWNDQLFNTPHLQSTQGHAIEVVSSGHWNFGAGPDFKNAVIRIDGQIQEGDVELHIYGCDWRAHGHSENNEYDDVILHVFLWQDRRGSSGSRKDTPSQSRPHIVELELKKYLKDGLLKLNEELDFDSYPLLNQFNTGLCHGPLSRLSKSRLEELLSNAGDARIQNKMDRFHDRIILNGYEQTFYEGVAEALGYPSNKYPFRDLAERVPFAELVRLVSKKGTPAEKALPLQAVLLGVSGLLGNRIPETSELEGEGLLYVQNVQKLWKKHKRRFVDQVMDDPTAWKFGGMRPANFPYRRIAALAHLVVKHSGSGLFQDFVSFVNTMVSISQAKGYNERTGKKATQYFFLEEDDFWSRHYTVDGKKLQGNQKLIGPDRARDIFINIAVPICLIYARASRSQPLEAFLHRGFSTQSSLADNQWLRFMKRYILGEKQRMLDILKSDRHTQGLMQVYQDFCTKNNNNCLRCRFPEVVDKYFS